MNWYFGLTPKIPPVPHSKQLSFSTLAYLLGQWQCPWKSPGSHSSTGHELLGSYTLSPVPITRPLIDPHPQVPGAIAGQPEGFKRYNWTLCSLTQDGAIHIIATGRLKFQGQEARMRPLPRAKTTYS